MNKYDPKIIEPKWQKFWEDNKTFSATEDPKKEKFFGLVEFPYPSGAGLHVGHPRSYTAMDVITRKKRMEGKSVLFPIGFDSFGLPTENFAIKTGRPPQEITDENIANFTRQLKALGFGFDWDRAVTTSEPEYYKWTQWIFLQLFKHGLAYKTNQPINWCPKDKIGLANEEVVDGCCERCGNPVEKRNKEQWMLAITKYADKLLAGLNDVDYISRAKTQQENWIGRSEGAEIDFVIQNTDQKVRVFTTRPDTLFGATYLVIAPEHALVEAMQASIQNWDDVSAYIDAAKRKTDMERTELQKDKSGVELKGVLAVNPASGAEIPVWVADYVLGHYGTGAIMAVPAHDERDFEFAQKFNLPIKEVIAPYIQMTDLESPRPEKETVKKNVVSAIIKRAGTDEYLLLLWENNICGLVGGGIEKNETAEQAVVREIEEETGYKNAKIKATILPALYSHGYKARKDTNCFDFDQIFLVEVSDDNSHGNGEADQGAHQVIWVHENDVLRKITKDHHIFVWNCYIENRKCFAGDGISINSDFLNELPTLEAKEKIISFLEEKGIGKRQTNFKLRDWVFSRQRYWGEPIPLVYCEKCAGWIPLPEDQLPLTLPKVEKYLPTDNGESPLAPMTDWVNTTCPQCGGPARRETDTMPNWAGSSWYWLRYADPHNALQFAAPEKLQYWQPVDWYNGGMEHTVLHLLYSRFWNQFLYDIGVVPTLEPYKKRTSHGMILASDGQKMSKSLGNVVNPDEMVTQFGADVLRAYILFMGPFDQPVAWDTNGLIGVRRFLDRVWNLQEKVIDTTNNSTLQTFLHQTIKKVTEDIENMRFNTAIAKLMELSNEMSKEEKIAQEDYQLFIQLLAPFTPHIAEELWIATGGKGSVAHASWPEYDAELAKESQITVVAQINGKVRDEFVVSPEISEEEIKQLVLSSEKIQKWLEGREPKKIIYVKGRLVSIVI